MENENEVSRPPTTTIPTVGLGTLRIRKNDVSRVIRDAIDIGYRFIDCAPTYQNEKEIGQAIRQLLVKESSAEVDDDDNNNKNKVPQIRREDLFLTSKIFNTHHVYDGEDRPRESLLQTLSDLQVDYLDLLLMHWPHVFPKKNPGRLRDKRGRPNPNLGVVEEYVDTWKSMEKMQKEGLVQRIGVSNFTVAQIERLLEVGLSKPFANQVELHIYLQQPELVEYCREKSIELIAYSPLSGPKKGSTTATGTKNNAANPPTFTADPVISEIASKYGISTAQVLLRWCRQHNFICIPKSTDTVHMRENFLACSTSAENDPDNGGEGGDESSFPLLDEQSMAQLASLDRGLRTSFGFLPDHF